MINEYALAIQAGIVVLLVCACVFAAVNGIAAFVKWWEDEDE